MERQRTDDKFLFDAVFAMPGLPTRTYPSVIEPYAPPVFVYCAYECNHVAPKMKSMFGSTTTGNDELGNDFSNDESIPRSTRD